MDLFEAFQSEAQGVAAMGQEMRRLLAPTELIRTLRGRGPRVEPYLKQLGMQRKGPCFKPLCAACGSSLERRPFWQHERLRGGRGATLSISGRGPSPRTQGRTAGTVSRPR